MRAVVAQGPGDFELADLPDPTARDGERVLEVEAAGVCAADRMLWRGDGPWTGLSWPFVPGHEVLGRDAATGQRVAVEVMVPCGNCPQCGRDRTNLCPYGAHIGSGLPGGFAEKLALPGRARVHPVPDHLPLRAAVLAEPMACALHAVRRAAVRPGDLVVVLGLGSIGSLAVHAARAEGASRVVAVTRSASRAALAVDIGADSAVTEQAALATLPAAADAVVECSGDSRLAATALRLAAPGGRVSLYGVYRRPATVDLNQIAELKELTVAGGHLAPGCFPDAIGLLETLPGDRLVTAVRPLADFRPALEPATGGTRIKEVLVP